MTRSLPLRCSECQQIVGSATVQNEKMIFPEDVEIVDSEVVLEQHLPDCSFLKALINGSLTGVSFGFSERKRDQDSQSVKEFIRDEVSKRIENLFLHGFEEPNKDGSQ